MLTTMAKTARTRNKVEVAKRATLPVPPTMVTTTQEEGMVMQAAIGLYRALGRIGATPEAAPEAVPDRAPAATTTVPAEEPEDGSRIPRVPSPSRSLRSEIISVPPEGQETPACSYHHRQSCQYSHQCRYMNTSRQRATPKAKAAATPVVKDHEEVHFMVRVPVRTDDQGPDGRYWCSEFGKRFHRNPNCWGLRTANRVTEIYDLSSRPGLTPCKLCARR